MRCAVDFFPPSMRQLMNLPIILFLYFGSGLSRSSKERNFAGIRVPLLPYLFLRALHAVLGAAGLAVLHAGAVERATDDVVAYAGQVAHAAAADEHDRVLLQVVPLAGDVGRGLAAARKAHAGDLPEGGVGLLGRHRLHDEADPPLLGVGLQHGGLALVLRLRPPEPDQLVDRRHSPPILEIRRSMSSPLTPEPGLPWPAAPSPPARPGAASCPGIS